MILHVSFQYVLEIPLQETFELGIQDNDKIHYNGIQRILVKPIKSCKSNTNILDVLNSLRERENRKHSLITVWLFVKHLQLSEKQLFKPQDVINLNLYFKRITN